MISSLIKYRFRYHQNQSNDSSGNILDSTTCSSLERKGACRVQSNIQKQINQQRNYIARRKKTPSPPPMVFKNRTKRNSESAAKSRANSRPASQNETEQTDRQPRSPAKRETGAIRKVPQTNRNNQRRKSTSETEPTRVLVNSEWPPLKPMAGKPLCTKEEQARQRKEDEPNPYATTADLS